MDPKATWQLILASYESDDWVGLFEHAANLEEWLTKGGAVPSLDGRQVLVVALDWARRLAAHKHAEGVDPEGRGALYRGAAYCLPCLDDHFPHAWDGNPEPSDILQDSAPVKCCKCSRPV
jgi:hypothetical protein